MDAITKQQARLAKVLQNMQSMALEDSDYVEMFIEILEAGLADLRDGDAFGSEGQCDPRGDQRNGEWSMCRVEGVDK